MWLPLYMSDALGYPKIKTGKKMKTVNCVCFKLKNELIQGSLLSKTNLL